MHNSEKSVLDKALEILLGTVLIVMTGLVLLQIIFRYFINMSLSWTEESARYLQAWMTFVGAGYAIKKGAHIAMEDVVRRLPKAVYNGFVFFADAVVAFFSGFTVWQGFTLVSATMRQTSPAIGIPMGLVYLALPVGALVALYYIVEKYVKKILSAKKNDSKAE